MGIANVPNKMIDVKGDFFDPKLALKGFAQQHDPKSQSKPDLVVLDIRMPHLNGLQLYHRLKAIDSHIKVLFVTALDASDEIITLLPEVRTSQVIVKQVTCERFVKSVNDIIKTSPDLADKHGALSVSVNISEGVENSLINVDRERITQVLTNVVNNAIKFTEQGNITVSVSRANYKIADKKNSKSGITLDNERRSIQIRITDTGAGIPKEVLTNLFAKFVTRSIKVGKEFKQGTGPGLYICKAIIKEHGGNIYAYNNENSIGVTFVIELPEL